MSFQGETIEFLCPDSDLVSLARRYVPTGAAFSANGLTFVFGHNVTSRASPILSFDEIGLTLTETPRQRNVGAGHQ